MGRPRLAIDIGGTFTDVAVECDDSRLAGRAFTTKVLTTPGDPVQGVLDGVRLALSRAGLAPHDIGAVIHGTTLATNALIERRGAAAGAIVTTGFRDILEIAYERRYDQYDLDIEKPDTLVPRDRVAAVSERVTATGQVLVPLDLDCVQRAVDTLMAKGVESIAVCLLHAYANPAHERAVRDVIERRRPGLPVSLSSEVSPEIREFDRLCTTVANACIKPLMARYLKDLAASLEHGGFDCPLFLMTSGGGMTTLETAMSFPVRLVESGPAGGAILAAGVARSRACPHVLSFDMGGTTAKVCLIEDGEPRTSRTFEVARAARFIKGSGLPVRIPVLEMIEIGAGGGSIASVDALSRLRVGPRSASSEPGPACYGRGGERPTVTDADAVAGYLDPDTFAEGRLRLDPDLARRAIERDIGAPLHTSAAAGADGISQMVDEAMANAARMHAVEQGKSLEDCVMVAFGGNGPLHAVRVAEKVGVRRIIVPPDPGAGSAIGFLSAPVSFELVRSHYVRVADFDVAAVNTLLDDMQRQAVAVVETGSDGAALTMRRTAFMRYRGQGHEIEIDIPRGTLDADRIARLVAAFEADYTRLYGRIVPGMALEVMSWSVRVSTTPEAPPQAEDCASRSAPEPTGWRVLTLGQAEETTVAACHRRADLGPGDTIGGPALIVEPQTTTFVSSRFEACIDTAGNIVMNCRPTCRERPEAASAHPDRGRRVPDAGSAIGHEVMWTRLQAVVEEQAQVLMRTAFSPIVRECGDISAGIFATDGRMLAQAVTGTPGHINTMAASVRLMLGHFPLSTMRPGDVYATNDPWLASGHLNDVLLVAPIFDGERPVALTACTSHLYDLGGLGMGPNGSDVHDEGLFIPPMKLVDRGEVSDLLVRILKANSRSPESNEGDLYALVACCHAGERRLLEMLREFGLTDLDALGTYILDTSSAAARAAIAQVPNGVYRNRMTLDGYDFEIVLEATMRVSDDTIVTDFAGSSACSRYGINVPLSYAAAYAVFGIRCVVGPTIPNNAGSLAPFVVTAPEGCIVNAPFPAPVAMRHTIGQLMPDLVLGCLHQALPGRIPAEGASCMWDIPIRSAALSRLHGNATPFAIELTHNGGTGARPNADGLSATAYPSGVWGSQVEVTEHIAPVRVRRRELVPDSGGAGRQRGGLGQIIELESSEGQPIALFTSVERTKHPARGRDGGADGRLGRISLRSGPRLTGKGEHTIPAGDRLVFETPGGGGYGNPLARWADDVATDVARGLVSREAAERLYGVAVDGEGRLDEDVARVHRGPDIAACTGEPAPRGPVPPMPRDGPVAC